MKRKIALRKHSTTFNLSLIFMVLAFIGISLLMSIRIEPNSMPPSGVPTQTRIPTATSTPVHLPATIEEVRSTCSQGECVQACISHVDDEFKGENFATPYYSADDVTLVYYGIKDDELVKPRRLKVSADLIPLQLNVNAHRNIWDYFRTIIPTESRPHLVQFVFYASSTSDGLYDETLYEDWLMYYNILARQDASTMTDILIHEYGHYMTLNKTQLDLEGIGCDQAYIHGCRKADSYLYLFYLQFWKDIYSEWDAINHDSKDYEKDIELFYDKYKDRFINQYASTDPVEDIAESWNAFIVQPTPSTNSIAGQKIKFFSQFPELVELRYQIIKGICTYRQAS